MPRSMPTQALELTMPHLAQLVLVLVTGRLANMLLDHLPLISFFTFPSLFMAHWGQALLEMGQGWSRVLVIIGTFGLALVLEQSYTPSKVLVITPVEQLF